jgi:hypothetical protein
MSTYAYPSRTKSLDTATVATLEDSLHEYDIPQAYRNALFMQLLLSNNMEPGLEIQGRNTLLPGLGIKRKTMGGTRAESFVNFESGSTAQFFSGLDILDTSISDGPTVTWSDYAYATCLVSIAGIEKLENSGAMKRLDILRSRQNQEVRGLVRAMETALHSTNTDTVRGSQNAFAGYQHKIKEDPTTSTVIQGLNQATYTPWANQTTTGGSFASQGLDDMREMWYSVSGVNGMEPPHLWTTTSTIAGYVTKALEGVHRIVGSLNDSDLSASKLPTHMGVPIVHTDDSPSGTMRVWNFDYIENIIHEGANWSENIPGEPNDQFIKDQKRYIFGAAPMMLTRREKQGVIHTITA